MSVLDTVRTAFGLRAKGTAEEPIINDGDRNMPTITVRPGMGGASWTGWDYANYPQRAREGYQKNSDVYSCVSLIAQAGKQVKWWDDSSESKSLQSREVLAEAVGWDTKIAAYRRNPTAVAKPNESIALLTKIGGPSFVEAWLSYILLSGNAFVEIIRERSATLDRKAPAFLYLDNPATVSAVPNPSADRPEQLVQAWKVSRPYGTSMKPRVLQPYRAVFDGDMVQSKLFHPLDPIYGMAPLEAAMLRIDATNEGTTLLKRMLQRGFVPGWIEAREDSTWTDVQIGHMLQRVRSSKRSGEELFLENAIWHQMGFTPTDSGVSEQQILSKRDIASVFHVDPALIGDTTNRTYATYAQSRAALYMEAVLPLLTQFRDDWNRSIGAELGSPLDFDRDSLDALTAAREEATDRVTKLWSTGLVTRDESRNELKFDPAKPGDVFYAPASFTPMSDDTTPADDLVP
jgi:HK97 family phage portal protein